ncbi:MAG: RNB domain-containing ribonuclease, partial [bacterium]|nr:RNB domain-containing ribonuclease [bacterium]
GKKVQAKFYKSVIRSQARLTYTLVRKVLVDKDPQERERLKNLLPVLQVMEELADVLQEERKLRGSIDFDLPEPEIVQGMEEGKIENIIRAERNKAHQMIEEFMIAANEAVATFVSSRGVPMIYRIHDKPSAEKIRAFHELLHHLGVPFRGSRRVTPGILADLVRRVKGLPVERMVNTMLLRSMQKAIYDVNNVGHFGLASTCYTHFTSPIRRYPDLLVHRVLEQVLLNQKNGLKLGRLKAMAEHCSNNERAAMKAEYAARDYLSCLFMQEKKGEEFPGIINGVTKFGLFVELIPYFVEGLVSVKKMKDDYYVFHEKQQTLIGRRTKKRLQIGDPIQVRLASVNLEKRWIDFEPVTE